MPKISQLPRDSSPATSDYVAGNQASGPSTQRFLLSDLITLFWTLANIPTGGTNPITRDNESQFAFVASGGVWSGDAYASTRNASMTALVCYVNGRRISISAVTARTFTASKDTYIDVLDNLDGTGTLVYTEVANNAASPALAANSMRIGIIVTGVSTIAAAGSVNQGSPAAILPIASSVAYSVVDSLGNLIYNRDPNPGIIGYRQVTSQVQTTNTSATYATGLSTPAIIPAGRKVRVSVMAVSIGNTTAANGSVEYIYSGASSGTLTTLLQQINKVPATNETISGSIVSAPATGLIFYTAAISSSVSGTTSLNGTNGAAYIMVELI